MSVVMLLLVTFCIIFPIISLLSIVYVRSIRQMEEMMTQRILAETASYAEILEQELQAIRLQNYNVLSDRTVTTLPVWFEREAQDSYFVLRLQAVQASLDAIIYGHDIIENVTIYYPRISRKVTSTSQSTYEEEKEGVEKIISQTEETKVWADAEHIVFWASSSFGDQTAYEDMNVVILTVLSKYGLESYLDRLVGDTGNGFALSAGGWDYGGFFVSTGSGLSADILPQEPDGDGHLMVELQGNSFLLSWAEVDGEMTFYQLSPFDRIQEPLRGWYQARIFFIFLLLCLLLLFTAAFYLMIQRPINHAKNTFMRMEKGELGVQMGSSWYVEFQNMYSQFDSMSRRIQDLVEREYELRLLNYRAQMKQLQHQINPHFLYNTYFVLRGLLQEEEYDQALQMSDVIGRYLKYITLSDRGEATLEEEVEHAKAYAQIQQIRFSKRVKICFAECPEKIAKRRVPKLIIQPLLENAFDHAIKDKLSGGFIRVRYICEPQLAHIYVEDNGEKLTDDMLAGLSQMLSSREPLLGESVALLNIHKRLVLMYGEGSGLFVSRSELGGLCCELVIRWKQDEKSGLSGEGNEYEKNPCGGR